MSIKRLKYVYFSSIQMNRFIYKLVSDDSGLNLKAFIDRVDIFEIRLGKVAKLGEKPLHSKRMDKERHAGVVSSDLAISMLFLFAVRAGAGYIKNT